MTTDLAVKVLEAILLAYRGKVNLNILKKFFSDFDLEELINKANDDLKSSGFLIYQDSQSVELVTKPELAKYLVNFFGLENNEITQDFLEVLAIIAYGGPIKLGEINRIRHKNSMLVIKSLVAEGLVMKKNFSYQISENFLSFLGFRAVTELPDYKKLRREIKKNLK
ncbi:MAG: segregation and condensation protein B [Candidatus Parcubacteria bacterium]|nr:MAG: segregation and condensation protein B [Candidatus Parcubacteria bacterium]